MSRMHAPRRRARWLLLVFVFGTCACGSDAPVAPRDGNAPVDGPTDDVGTSHDGGTMFTFPAEDGERPAPPLLDDAGVPMNSRCLLPLDAGHALTLDLVELSGRLETLNLTLPADCARGHLVAPAGAPAAVLLRGENGDFDLNTDCQGNFRALVPPGRYRVRAQLHWFDQQVQTSATWYTDLLDEPILLTEPRALSEPLRARFFTLSGTVALGANSAPSDAPAAPCLKLAALERRTDGARATVVHFNARCDGHFLVPVPAGSYDILLNGPFPGKEAALRLASGTLRLTDGPVAVTADSHLTLAVPLVRLHGQVTADFELPCQGTKSRLDVRDTRTNAIFTLPLCAGSADGFVPPAEYAASLISDVGTGNTRIALPGTVDLRAPDPPDPPRPLQWSVRTRPASGQVFLNGPSARNPADGAQGTMVLLGRRGHGFTGWVPPGMPYAFNARLADDTYDLSIHAWQFLPGGRFEWPALYTYGTNSFEAPAQIAISTSTISGEIRFGNQPAHARCAGYTITFQAHDGSSTVIVTPLCAEGRLRFASALYPGEYRVWARHPNGHVEAVLSALSVNGARSDVVLDLAPLLEHPITGSLVINGCRLRELPGVCAASYTVTLTDPDRGLTYTLAPVFQDQPFAGQVTPGRYRAAIRFAPLCETSPLFAVPGPIPLATPVIVP